MSKKTTKLNVYLLLSFCVLTSVLSIFNIVSFITFKPQTTVLASSDNERKFWQTVITKYPNYKDGYIILAQIEEGRGNIEIANLLRKQVISLQ